MTVTLSGIPVLTTDRLTLRAPAASDWPQWRAFMASDRSAFIRPDDIDDAKAWRALGHVIGMWVLRGYGQFVYCRTGSDEALGMCGPWHPVDWPEREIGWHIWTAEAEGKGFAFEAASAARDYAFGPLGWDTAVSYIDPANDRSIALALRLGARRDTEASTPHPEEPTLVYRHPKPGAAA
jgi:RimJ/RimL family protein N-acetyltransferase